MSRDDVDPMVKMWQLNDCETWIGVDLHETIDHAVKESGQSEEEIIENIREIHRSDWSKLLITEIDEKYQPRYTYKNYLIKMADEGSMRLPMLFASTEY